MGPFLRGFADELVKVALARAARSATEETRALPDTRKPEDPYAEPARPKGAPFGPQPTAAQREAADKPQPNYWGPTGGSPGTFRAVGTPKQVKGGASESSLGRYARDWDTGKLINPPDTQKSTQRSRTPSKAPRPSQSATGRSSILSTVPGPLGKMSLSDALSGKTTSAKGKPASAPRTGSAAKSIGPQPPPRAGTASKPFGPQPPTTKAALPTSSPIGEGNESRRFQMMMAGAPRQATTTSQPRVRWEPGRGFVYPEGSGKP